MQTGLTSHVCIETMAREVVLLSLQVKSNRRPRTRGINFSVGLVVAIGQRIGKLPLLGRTRGRSGKSTSGTRELKASARKSLFDGELDSRYGSWSMDRAAFLRD